jgi:magnesium-protoporphyrin O-methyltransferase
MSCCTRCYDEQFDDAQARHDLKRFRKHGPAAATRKLLSALRSLGLDDATLLDIGGGIGAVHHELLDAGAQSAVHADASAPFIAVAKEEARRRGHADRVTFVHGDFVALAPAIAAATVVTLDRVICCYADMEAMVAASASHAQRLYGAVYPRERWYIRLVLSCINAFNRIRRRAFRVYLHSPAAIDAAIARQGLIRRTCEDTFIWRAAVYERQ